VKIRFPFFLLALFIIPVQVPGHQGIDHSPWTEPVNPYLSHAEAGARYLISIADEPSPGLYRWPCSDRNDTLFYLDRSMGASGIGSFFLKLYNSTGNSTYLKYAQGAGRYLISCANETSPDSCRWSYIEGYPYYNPDHYGGAGYVIEYLLELYGRTGNATYLEYAKKGGNWLVNISVPVGKGFKWETFPGGNYNMTGWYHGTAGISYVLLELYEATGNETYLRYCLGGARYLMDIAIGPVGFSKGYTWVRVENDIVPNESWCGGTTGIVQFFLEVYRSTGNTTCLGYARGGCNWLIEQAAKPAVNCSSIYPTNMFCHGDPSCAWIMFRMNKALDIPMYDQYGRWTLNWLMSQREDLEDNATRWPSLPGGDEYLTGLLMGASGIGHSFILSHELTGNETYRDMAFRAANWVGGQAIQVSDGERWNYWTGQDTEYYSGWYYGIAGIGEFMLEVARYWEAPPSCEIELTTYPAPEDIPPRVASKRSITIDNVGELAFTPSVAISQPPPGWEVSYSLDRPRIPAFRSGNLVVSLTPPKTAMSGDVCNISVTVHCLEDPTEQDHATIEVVVAPSFGLDIRQETLEGAIDPFGNVTFDLMVENTGSLMMDASFSFSEHGSEWTVSASDISDIAPGSVGSSILVIGLLQPLPAGTAIGLVVTASHGLNDHRTDSVIVTVRVNESSGFDVLTSNITSNVDPGSTTEYRFRIWNTGTISTNVTVTATPPPIGWTVDVSPTISIPPGSIEEATIKVTAPTFPKEKEMLIGLDFENGTITLRRSIGIAVSPMRGVKVLDRRLDETLNGSYARYLVDVKNTGSDTDTIRLTSYPPPDGWFVTTEFDGSMMASGEVRTALVSIRRSSNTSTFRGNISLEARCDLSSISDNVFIDHAFSPWASIALSGTEDASALPGEQAVLIVELVISGNTPGDVTVTASSGWMGQFLQEDLFDQRRPMPGSILRFEVPVLVPQDARATDHAMITVTAASRYDTNATASIDLPLTVLPVSTFEMSSPIGRMRIDHPGRCEFIIRIMNTGNTDQTLELELVSGREGWANLSFEYVHIPYNESEDVVLFVRSMKHVDTPVVFTVIARSGDMESSIDLVVETEGSERRDPSWITIGIPFLAVLIIGAVAYASFFVLKSRGGRKNMPEGEEIWE